MILKGQKTQLAVVPGTQVKSGLGPHRARGLRSQLPSQHGPVSLLHGLLIAP